MKKFVIILGILLVSFSQISMAQSGKLGKLIKKYKGTEALKVIDINADINMDNLDGEEFFENIDKILIVSLDSDKNYSSEETRKFYDDAIEAIKKDGYEEMMNVMDGEDRVNFYINKKDGEAKECVLAVSEKDETALIYISGIIDFSKAMGMLGNLNINSNKECEKEKETETEIENE